jgi:hypothetical protein
LSSCSKHWTWRSGDAAGCAPPARSTTPTKARGQHTSVAFSRRLASKDGSGAWATSATRSTTRCASR